MVRIKSRLKFRWILYFVIFSLALLIYENHLFRERAKKLEDMRKKKHWNLWKMAGRNTE